MDGQNVARCSRCNRPLKDGQSVAQGMGPTCAAKEGVRFPRLKQKGGVQGFMFKRSAHAVYSRHDNDGVLVIVDGGIEGHSFAMEHRQVLMDIEGVDGIDTHNRPVIFRDEDGHYKRIMPEGPVDFRRLTDTEATEDEAVYKAWTDWDTDAKTTRCTYTGGRLVCLTCGGPVTYTGGKRRCLKCGRVVTYNNKEE